MDLIQINTELYSASQRLSNGASRLFTLAKKQAEAESKYRKALAIEIMRLKLDKLPATLILDLARGNCSEEKFARDLAEAEYVSGRDALKAIETQVSALQSILRYQAEVPGR